MRDMDRHHHIDIRTMKAPEPDLLHLQPEAEPAFHIGHVPVYGRTILSPMDGYSDLPFRAMCRTLGSAMSYTEFVNALDILQGHPRVAQKLAFRPEERPIVFQIFDDDPGRLLNAALQLQEHEPDIIDINMGCSARRVSGRGAGAGLLRAPEKVAQIFGSLSRALEVPVTGKIRLGWDNDTRNFGEVAAIVEENGGAAIAVHGRTKSQGYGGQADWNAIAEIKEQVSIPVIGNGDVQTTSDIDRMARLTGCDAVMIARAAIGNPWIFAGLDRERVPPDLIRDTMLRHLSSMLDFYGPEQGLILFRKHASRYISPFRLTRSLRERLLTSETPEDFSRLLAQIVKQEPVGAGSSLPG